VRTFLGRAGRLAPGQVAAVLRVDQAARWAAGDRVTARDYLRDFPALDDDPEAAFEVVYHERLLLEDRGESPDPEAFRRLYPEFADRLRVQEEVRAALARLAPEDTDVPSSEGIASPADRPRFAPIVAGYEILGELGRGGMGVVYKARHLRLNRVVAVKMLRAGDAAPDVVARLLAEAEAVARLRHPNIIQLHGVGEAEGRPFLEMEYVAGGSLADRLDGTPRPPRAMAELVEALARALHEAHRLGVVHRDVKPANVLIAEDGTPKLTDFGLAKLLGASANPVAMTRSGALLGTPSYMAPEQADGRTREVGPAADVHALGVLLYELLTGRRPFPGPSVVETLEQIRSVAPTPPRSLVPTLPRDLETACLKCLEKDPARRYADARTLADDLRNYLSGAPIVARPSGVLDRLARAIGQGRHDRDFAAAGSLRLWTFIPFLVAFHATVFLLAVTGSPYLQAGMYALVIAILASQGVAAFLYRTRRLAAPTPAAQLVGALFVGQSVAALTTLEINRRLVDPALPYRELAVYPYWSVVVGMMFMAMGAHYWGGLYVAGAAFFLAAPVLARHLLWAPLIFALLMALAFVSAGLRLRRFDRESSAADFGGSSASPS
jgi:predicted Ser/Thr protein kinase